MRKSAKKTGAKTKKKILKDPKGGLTKAGRDFFARKEGAHLKPGVRGKADTPEKMKRKGSFLRRHFANPRGPMVDGNGKPTRLALSAHAWGESVPKTLAAAKRLAKKGLALLEKYHRRQESAKKAPSRKTSTSKVKKRSTTKKRKSAGKKIKRGKTAETKKTKERRKREADLV